MANIQTESARDTRADSAATPDEHNELKRRARRRLVGASALALAAVIVLPMVMDHEPRPPAQDIQVRIPSQEGSGLAARVLPGKGPTPLPPAVEPKPVVAPVENDSPPETRPEAKPEVKGAIKAESKTMPIKPPAEPKASPATVETKPAIVAKPVEKPQPKPAEPRTAEQKKDAGEASRAAAALSGGTATASEQWVVQLGAYKETGNVKLLIKKLKEMGVPAYTESFDSPQGPRTRVRAGPFSTKEAAEKAQSKAKIVGVSGPVAPK